MYKEGEDSFLFNFQFYEKDPADIGLTVMYFGMTTLSTVGFGDYYPVSNPERVMGCIIFLSGVTMFSYIFNSYVEILKFWLILRRDYIDDKDLD